MTEVISIERKPRAGFTLVEIMVVVIIIAMIAGAVIMNVGDAPDKAGRMLAGADIATIETALKSYKLDHGHYPESEDGLKLLLEPAPERGQTESYVKSIADPWKREYHYRIPSTHKGHSFDIWSAGPDGESGTSDDITSWKNGS
jgi:general secretion pathway protein G